MKRFASAECIGAQQRSRECRRPDPQDAGQDRHAGQGAAQPEAFAFHPLEPQGERVRLGLRVACRLWIGDRLGSR